ncbi:F0F1 ATP synthase subunit epsilon [Desulfococcaceae bacterium OttesenSCG-928-F15]|nr:F0F1 ATP synthase subunit epsilon [Desulfococcaceae bacterium OttesenSCG-928-F15]
MAVMKVEIVTPESVVVDGRAQTFVAPGAHGEFGVLPGHTPFLTSLKTGAIRYINADNIERQVFIKEGFIEVLPGKITVLAEVAERRMNISLKRAEAAYQRALERLKHIEDKNIDHDRAHAALMRAAVRIHMVHTKM